jgi:hypothetical protein
MSTCGDIYLENIGRSHRTSNDPFLLLTRCIRAYMDNVIMQALLFQYIGMQWSVTLKSAFRSVVESRAWKCDITRLSHDQLKCRHVVLQESPNSRSIEMLRKSIQLDRFFLTQLPSSIEAETPYDEEPKQGEKPNPGLNTQQILLRLVHLNMALHGSCTIMRADLEWYTFHSFSEP